MRTMGTAKGHIKALSYRKLTSFLGLSCPPPRPSNQLTERPSFVLLPLFPSLTCLVLSR